MNEIWSMFAFFGLSQYFDQGSSVYFSLRVDYECNRLFFATVFECASAFNGDLNQWNVAKVTNMRSSKSGFPYEISLWDFMFFWVATRDGVLLDVAWFCVCAFMVWVVCWRGMNVGWVVVDAKSVCALGDRRVFWLHQVDTYVWGWRNIPWTCSCDWRIFTQEVWVGGVMDEISRTFAFFGLSQYFDQGSPVFFSCMLTVNVIGLFFLATVFDSASAFNRNLTQWDVAKVTYMRSSKSIRILENDLTWRELILLWLNSYYCDWRVQSGSGWWWWCDVKMVERSCSRMREIKCTPMAHCTNVYGLWQTVIFLWNVLMTFHAFWPLWDFQMRFYVCWPLSQTELFQSSWGLGLVVRTWGKGMHASEFGRKGAKLCSRVILGEGGGRFRICWEEARATGCVWSLSLRFFRPHYFHRGSSAFSSCVDCDWTLPPFRA